MMLGKMSILKYELIRCLADGRFHSDEKLGDELRIIPSSIAKIIQQLCEMGLIVYRIEEKGYQLSHSIELLDLATLHHFLPESLLKQVEIEIVQEVNSTNQLLLDQQADKRQGAIVLAEYQTHGRGRLARKWFSPFGANIYLSLLWHFDHDPAPLNGLSLAAGVAVAHALERYGIDQIQLKWPNDVLWHCRKISGILIEMPPKTPVRMSVVIGIGLNVQMPPKTQIDQAWVDVATITGQKPRRNLLVAYLIEEMIEMMALFKQKGLAYFVKHWQARDAYYGKPVIVSTPLQHDVGIAKGINSQGEFLLLNKENKELRFLHAEIRLRGNTPL
jgi:BirA family transcriptional regulator, biotin operon repressor / biotin---[acetyl-CoA-carboxylase] ligase